MCDAPVVAEWPLLKESTTHWQSEKKKRDLWSSAWMIKCSSAHASAAGVAWMGPGSGPIRHASRIYEPLLKQTCVTANPHRVELFPYGVTPDPSPKQDLLKALRPFGRVTVQTGAFKDGGGSPRVGSGTKHLVHKGWSAKSRMQDFVSVGRPYLRKKSRMFGHP